MENIDDIVGTVYVFRGGRSREFDKVYYSSNEQIEDIFSSFDFNGKDVLSVLGSGDQAFYFTAKGARSVDVYDQNKLAIYYFYLRIWCIKYYNELYPNAHLDKNYIKRLLDLVTPESEEEIVAYRYWKTFNALFNNSVSDIFNFTPALKLNDAYLDVLKNNIGRFDFEYYDTNMLKKFKNGKKYDFIYTSNIPEWTIRGENFKLYRNNLKRLLNKKGIVISSNINNMSASRQQIRVMEKSFEYCELPEVWHKETKSKRALGYYYVKR